MAWNESQNSANAPCIILRPVTSLLRCQCVVYNPPQGLHLKITRSRVIGSDERKFTRCLGTWKIIVLGFTILGVEPVGIYGVAGAINFFVSFPTDCAFPSAWHYSYGGATSMFGSCPPQILPQIREHAPFLYRGNMRAGFYSLVNTVVGS
ncbi:hypothetical protein GQ44DRAFT_293048 [Phaeosphaeriaceae sp. PMI808]|nr:hypothetical protein GQ44DRAFT_293048 [Phaeosphaeriaceae sp. PMI808]